MPMTRCPSCHQPAAKCWCPARRDRWRAGEQSPAALPVAADLFPDTLPARKPEARQADLFGREGV